MDSADLVGYIVGEEPTGRYVFACGEHAPAWAKAEVGRQVLRDEATEEGATCAECGADLSETEGTDG